MRTSPYSKSEKKMKFGIFLKRGWKAVMLVESREQGEEILKRAIRYSNANYEVREIEWGEDYDKKCKNAK